MMNHKIKFRVLAWIFGSFVFFILICNIYYFFQDFKEIGISVQEDYTTKSENSEQNTASFSLRYKFHLLKEAFVNTINKRLDDVCEKNGTRQFFIQIYGLVLKQIHPYQMSGFLRLENEHLATGFGKYDCTQEAQAVVHFKKILSNKKISFIFLLAPHKIYKYAPMLCKGVTDYSNENADFYLNILRKGNVEVLDSREIFKDSPEIHYNLFYKTDTHWKTEYAFRVFQELAPILQKYGIEIEPHILNKNNYELLYQGKMIGISKRFGSLYLPDEALQVMQPKWETKLKLVSQWGNLDYTGPFSAFDFVNVYPDLTVQNMNTTTHKKILFFSDSFGQFFSGFLALVCSQLEVHIMNEYSGNLLQEIEKFQPDIVIGMYNVYSFCARDYHKHYGLSQE